MRTGGTLISGNLHIRFIKKRPDGLIDMNQLVILWENTLEKNGTRMILHFAEAVVLSIPIQPDQLPQESMCNFFAGHLRDRALVANGGHWALQAQDSNDFYDYKYVYKYVYI